jgi:uncharacterized protein with ATP-grasp and redox domains
MYFVRILDMKLQYECITCIISQVLTVAKMLDFDEAQKETAIRNTLYYLSRADYEGCTPESMAELWGELLRDAKSDDPYESIKSLCNHEAMKMEQRTREAIHAAEDPFTKALKYAIAGNLVDYGLEHPVALEEQNRQIDEISSRQFAADDSPALKEALKKAGKVLYLCDNAGEILFDKLLIEYIGEEVPQAEVICAVRGKPVLNDVTQKDALEVGMGCVARIIDNGDGSPGTVLHRTSKAFLEEYSKADVVIAKGQGNYESLSGDGRENLFFLFMAKCSAICQIANVPKMSIICLKNVISAK